MCHTVLLLPAQLPGTHWVMICMIWRLALTVSDVCLNLGCFQSTSTYSVLEVSYFMRCINSRLTWLLAITWCTWEISCPTIASDREREREKRSMERSVRARLFIRSVVAWRLGWTRRCASRRCCRSIIYVPHESRRSPVRLTWCRLSVSASQTSQITFLTLTYTEL